MPNELFENTQLFIHALNTIKDEFLSNIYNITASDNDVNCPYSNEDFSVYLLMFSDELYCILIMMPEVATDLQCIRVYIMFNEEYTTLHYITVEAGTAFTGNFEVKNTNHICEWTKEVIHNNYGTADSSDEEYAILSKILLKN